MTSTREALQSVVARLAEVIDQLPAEPPTVPDRVEVWPENDEHLRNDCWKNPGGSIISYRDGKWRWWNSRNRTWHLKAKPGLWTPLNRIPNPFEPHGFGSLADQPEVPDTIEQWPDDDTDLRGEFWKCSWGSVISYRGDGWHWWDHVDHCWHPENHPGETSPLTRTTDPSQPRRFDSLADIPEDMDRAAGKYQSYPCELARSPLSGTGWMMQVHRPYVLQQWAEYMGLDEDDLTDIEEVIDHE